MNVFQSIPDTKMRRTRKNKAKSLGSLAEMTKEVTKHTVRKCLYREKCQMRFWSWRLDCSSRKDVFRDSAKKYPRIKTNESRQTVPARDALNTSAALSGILFAAFQSDWGNVWSSQSSRHGRCCCRFCEDKGISSAWVVQAQYSRPGFLLITCFVHAFVTAIACPKVSH